MKNTKVLDMLNNGRVEELKALLQEEIYTEGLSTKSGAQKRYSAMKKYFSYKESHNPTCKKPCIIDLKGTKYTSFCNAASLILTTETAEGMEHFAYPESYLKALKVEKVITYDGTKKEIDFTKVFAEAKSKGYKLKKSEVNGSSTTYFMYYDRAYYNLAFLDAAYSIINDGEKAEVYHADGGKYSPITIKNDIGIAVVCPISVEPDDGKVIVDLLEEK